MKNSRNHLLCMGVALLIVAGILAVFHSGEPATEPASPVRRSDVRSKLASSPNGVVPRPAKETPALPIAEVNEVQTSAGGDSAAADPESASGGFDLPSHTATPLGFVDSPQDPFFPRRPSFSNNHAWHPVDPEAPGHQLSFQGQVARVVASQAVAGSNGVALSVIVEDLPVQSASATDLPATPKTEDGAEESAAAHESAPAAEGLAASPSESGVTSRFRGLSYEQQLFRTKWGWSAFDQMQKTLQTTSN